MLGTPLNLPMQRTTKSATCVWRQEKYDAFNTSLASLIEKGHYMLGVRKWKQSGFHFQFWKYFSNNFSDFGQSAETVEFNQNFKITENNKKDA